MVLGRKFVNVDWWSVSFHLSNWVKYIKIVVPVVSVLASGYYDSLIIIVVVLRSHNNDLVIHFRRCGGVVDSLMFGGLVVRNRR